MQRISVALHWEVATAFHDCEAVLWAVAREVADITRLHHLVLSATDPEVWNGEIADQTRDLSNGTSACAVHQKALGCTLISLKWPQVDGKCWPQSNRPVACLPEPLKGPWLINPTTSSDTDHPYALVLFLLLKIVRCVQDHAGSEGMAHQHNGGTLGTFEGLNGQPASIGRKRGSQSGGSAACAESGQVRAPKRPVASSPALFQGAPHLAAEQPAMDANKKGAGAHDGQRGSPQCRGPKL